MTNRFSVIGILMVTLAAARPSSANECFEAELCQRVNGDVDVFVGKILTEIDDDGAVRVHVVRSFKGSAKVDIPVVVIPIGLLGLPSYEIGESYLFYASKASDNGVTTRHAGGCAGAAKLKEVSREELSFLEGLGFGKQTGDVFGVVVREGNFDDRIRDLQVILTGGGRRYSSKTDRDGNFRLTDVAPGTYNFVFDGRYDDILLRADENIEITPHGCVAATVLASHNATVGGRVVLPTGFSVDGLVVNAFTLDGREVAEAFADKDGRYIIVGIKPGDYIVGVNAGRFPPTPDRPFSPTYAPSAIERERASRVHIETGTHLREVDIWVNNASPLATFTVHATFDDGEPVDDAAFSLTRLIDGSKYRERRRLSVASKSAAQRWGEDRERHVLRYGPPQPQKEVPTLKDFAPRFLDSHARANRQKPSGIAAKEMVLRVRLVPFLGHKRLNVIGNEDVQRFKKSLIVKAPKTVNNSLSVLSVLLKKAVEWNVIDRMPCTVRLLPVPKSSASFHDFEQYERLVETAHGLSRVTELIVLLGGDAGLRCGEMIALEWSDVDLGKRQLCIQRSDWNGEITSTKGGRLRYIPLTVRLAGALREHRHLRGPRVLCEADGKPFTRQIVQAKMKLAAKHASVRNGVHILRHTFCSHLAMRGAPARAIQELAGHSELGMTQRYMHLSPAALDAAIQLLDAPRHAARAWQYGGDEQVQKEKSLEI